MAFYETTPVSQARVAREQQAGSLADGLLVVTVVQHRL
jgi:hypothetical protein